MIAVNPLLQSHLIRFDRLFWGVDGGVYEISKLIELQLMQAHLDRDYVIVNDIDASATRVENYSSGIWGVRGFTPIGDQVRSFTGSLDGGGHVISNLKIDLPNKGFVGLIGFARGATIPGVGLASGSVSGSGSVGGLPGYGFDTKIGASHSNLSVQASPSVQAVSWGR